MTDFFIKNWLIISFSFFIYFLPTFISLFNSKCKSFGIFLINLILGWTIIMWISLFIEAFQDPFISRYDDAENDYEEIDSSQKETTNTNKVINEFSKFTSTKALNVWLKNLK